MEVLLKITNSKRLCIAILNYFFEIPASVYMKCFPIYYNFKWDLKELEKSKYN